MATVDEHGNVTAVGKGEAVITVTTVSPYHAVDTCTVKVALHHQVTARQEHGKITFEPDNPLLEGQEVRLTVAPDSGYQLKEGSFKAFKTGEESSTVEVNGDRSVGGDGNSDDPGGFDGSARVYCGLGENPGEKKESLKTAAYLIKENGILSLKRMRQTRYKRL